MFALCVLLGATVGICAVDTFVQGYETVFNLLESLTFLGAMVLWIILQQLISKDLKEEWDYLFETADKWKEEHFEDVKKLMYKKSKLEDILKRLQFHHRSMTDEDKAGIKKELDDISF
jgi:hypothetical protein